jgi:protein gp37
MEHYFQQGVGTEMVVRDNVKYELAVAESLRWPLPNVWLGVSVESPKYLSRIDVLREVPAAVRMVSFEPLLSDLGEVNLDGIGWVIVGGESGPKARPMHPRWARSLRDQCEAARVPFFFKQWGEWGLGGGHPSGTPGRFVLVSDTQSCEVSCEVDQYPRHFNSFGSAVMERLGKHAAGRLLDGVEWSEYPERVA